MILSTVELGSEISADYISCTELKIQRVIDTSAVTSADTKVFTMKKVEVVAGIITFQDQILCVQRPQNKLHYISEKFEFPGGKIEAGETKEEALQRELVEELNVSVKINSFYLTVEHQYPDFELTMHSFKCEVDSKELTLNEHIDQKWLKREELENLDWAAADIPIVNKLVLNG